VTPSCFYCFKEMLEKTERATKNEHYRDTVNIWHTRHRTKTGKQKPPKNKKLMKSFCQVLFWFFFFLLCFCFLFFVFFFVFFINLKNAIQTQDEDRQKRKKKVNEIILSWVFLLFFVYQFEKCYTVIKKGIWQWQSSHPSEIHVKI
jgi:4-amino-4-deoxy-L-arabinose transferase-like glycosyltransferase